MTLFTEDILTCHKSRFGFHRACSDCHTANGNKATVNIISHIYAFTKKSQ